MDSFTAPFNNMRTLRVLSIMPNWPVREQQEYLRKMERHFPIKSGQPIEMAVVILNFVAEFPNKGKEPVCQISVGIFPPKYVDHLQRWSRKFRSEETETNLSNLNFDRNSRNLWHNRKHPKIQSSTDKFVFCYRQSNARRLLPAFDCCRARGNEIAVYSSHNEQNSAVVES